MKRAAVWIVLALATGCSSPDVADDRGGSNPGCHGAYSGCVPIASDVDCADGNGDGPRYVRGPVRVHGADPYGLDRDGDGIGCNG